jgi:hypothetical protein
MEGATVPKTAIDIDRNARTAKQQIGSTTQAWQWRGIN